MAALWHSRARPIAISEEDTAVKYSLDVRAKDEAAAPSPPSRIAASRPRHAPGFVVEDMDRGAGADGGIARNRYALDAIELSRAMAAHRSFGRPYAVSIGIAPMGRTRDRVAGRRSLSCGRRCLPW